MAISGDESQWSQFMIGQFLYSLTLSLTKSNVGAFFVFALFSLSLWGELAMLQRHTMATRPLSWRKKTSPKKKLRNFRNFGRFEKSAGWQKQRKIRGKKLRKWSLSRREWKMSVFFRVAVRISPLLRYEKNRENEPKKAMGPSKEKIAWRCEVDRAKFHFFTGEKSSRRGGFFLTWKF